MSLSDPLGWFAGFERPLRVLPRWGAALVLFGAIGALVWSSVAVSRYAQFDAVQKRETVEQREGRSDVDLYARINARMSEGQDYYTAALAEQRADNYPTRPFVTVRLPTMAWGALLWGERGWLFLAITLLGANLLAWIAAPPRATLIERIAVGLLIVACGIGATYERVGLVHDLVAGLLLSLALALYRPSRWWPALIAVALALAIREIALPFVLLWVAFAASQRRWRELGALGTLLALFAIVMAFHAWNVAEARLPGDPVSPGWQGLHGPQIVLNSLIKLTPLLLLQPAVAAPLALLPMLGWSAVGGRQGVFALVWFAGFGLGMALFARANNHYWVLLILPAYAAGIAFVPRALADLARALRGPTRSAASSAAVAPRSI
ncbi:hypothetical protein [Pseudoblastomonas halimionae]|uniref:DUF2029 domain-containing protein n=1 Tax=Alteriqipengyuania halimionae TaxID=1926630 RepID=A0A6I4U3I3_9SPHN|nr:hypothetical protein [Alteriqipengyuania halimionae]MXP08777.1 hypothetical protein [Alteriqipengyuania halimionae]